MSLSMRTTLLIFLLCATAAFGQIFTANVTGVVTDPTGSAIANAQVQISNIKTGDVRQVKSDESGRYTFSQLPPGQYELSVSAAGFKRYSTVGIALVANQTAEYNAGLSIGDNTQSVEVTASVIAVDPQTANKSVTFTPQEMVELPVGLRSPLLLVHDTAGVNAVRMGIEPYMTDQNTNRFALNGGRDESSTILVDGVPIAAPGWGGAIATPSSDATAEVQIVRQAYDTQYGKTDGGAVNIVTKGGTSDLHASAFEYLRNNVLNANSWANNRTNTAKPSYQRHQFGGNVGGPLWESKKLFFFTAFESLKQATPTSTYDIVPTEAMKGGDFSNVLNTKGALAQIYDPFSTNTTTLARTPVSGNVIPASRFDSVGKNVVNLFPDPNQSTPVINGGVFATGGKLVSNYYKIDERVDWVKSEKDTLFGRITKAWQTDSVPIFFGHGADSTTGEQDPRFQVVLGNTWVPSPTMVVNLLIGVGRWHEKDLTSSSGFAGSIGLPASVVKQFQTDTLPQFGFSNYAQLGYDEYNQNVRQVENFQLNATKELRSHSLKFGALFEMSELNTNDAFSGNFNFNQDLTSGPTASTGVSATGNDIASLLMGTGSGGSVPYNAELALTQHDYALYFHDTWRVTQRLTFSYGARYEIQAPRTERFNRFNYFDFNATNPLSAATGLNLKGGLVYGHKDMWNPDYNDVAPRGSLAYKISEKLVFRAGYGVFFPPTVAVANGPTDGYSTSTSWLSTQGGTGLVPANVLSNPYPSGFNNPVGGANGLLTEVGQAVNAASLLHPSGYTQSYSADFQYQIGKAGMAEVGYTGVQGRKLLMGAANMNIDQLNSSYLSQGSALNAQVKNPFYGVITSPTSVLSGPTVPAFRLLTPYPQFSSVMLSPDTPGSGSSFNALTAKYNQRLSNGLNMLLTYQWSKAIDNVSETQVWEIKNYTRDINNLAAERSISGHDVPQDFRAAILWELPVGRGKRYGSNMNKIVDQFIGGWRLSTVVRLADGLPLQFTSSNGNGAYGFVVQRPNVTSLPALASVPGGKRIYEWFNTSTAVSSAPAAFTLGDMPRYVGNIRTGATNDTDFLLSKAWTYKEHYRLQFRAEAYNLTNTPQYGAANTNRSSGSYGQVTGTMNIEPRNIQLAMRLDF
jgi:hypothetical protein